MSRRKKNYEVGYGKPPKGTRYQPGESGNLKGRPKGSRNYSTVMETLLKTRVSINKDGRKRKVPLVEAVGLRLANKALGGDFRSMLEVLAIARSFEQSGQNAARGVSAADQAAMDVFVSRVKSGAFDPAKPDDQQDNENDGEGEDK